MAFGTFESFSLTSGPGLSFKAGKGTFAPCMGRLNLRLILPLKNGIHQSFQHPGKMVSKYKITENFGVVRDLSFTDGTVQVLLQSTLYFKDQKI